MDVIIVSIGTLSKNPLWNERVPVRSSHATTTLIRTVGQDDKTPVLILVDPSLPGQILDARLYERAGIKSDAISHIFLTNWRPIHRRGLEQFSHAVWWMNGAEIDAASAALDAAEEHAARLGHPGERGGSGDELVAKERALLDRVQAAPDQLAAGVDLYPLPGYTPGQCGLLISEPTRTTVIAGDAVPTEGHFAAAQVLADSWDLEKAKESLREMYEVADIIVPGHDNLFVAPRAGGL